MMRIEVRSQTAQAVVLRVEVDCWLEQGRRVVLDLEKLRGLCPAGLALIHSWHGKPVELRRMPRLIASLVELLHGRQGLRVPPCRPPEPALQPVGEG